MLFFIDLLDFVSSYKIIVYCSFVWLYSRIFALVRKEHLLSFRDISFISLFSSGSILLGNWFHSFHKGMIDEMLIDCDFDGDLVMLSDQLLSQL